MRVCACCEYPLGPLVLAGLTRVPSNFSFWLSGFCVDSHLSASYNCVRVINRKLFFNICYFSKTRKSDSAQTEHAYNEKPLHFYLPLKVN